MGMYWGFRNTCEDESPNGRGAGAAEINGTEKELTQRAQRSHRAHRERMGGSDETDGEDRDFACGGDGVGLLAG